MSTHTKGAMRAAKLICDAGYCGTYDFVAEIIDRETGTKDMLEALKELQMAVVSGDLGRITSALFKAETVKLKARGGE